MMNTNIEIGQPMSANQVMCHWINKRCKAKSSNIKILAKEVSSLTHQWTPEGRRKKPRDYCQFEENSFT